MGHLGLIRQGSSIILESDSELEILQEWIEKFGGHIVTSDDLIRYVAPYSEESGIHAVALKTIRYSFDPKNDEASQYIQDYSKRAIDSLLKFDLVDDYVRIEPEPFADSSIRLVRNESVGLLPIVDTLEELLEVLNYFPRRARPMIWRGHERIGYGLDSAIYRKYRGNLDSEAKSKVTRSDPERYIQSVEERWVDDAHSRGHNFRDGERLSELQFFSLVQHQGGATRLLDFSWNMFVALWFACHPKQHSDTTGLLFGIVLDWGQRRNTRFLRARADVQRSIAELTATYSDSLLVWQPQYHSPRMHIQQAVFAFSRIRSPSLFDAPYGSLILPGYDTQDPIPRAGNYLRVALSPKFKDAMRFRWSSMFGYSQSKMFPDFEGFAQNWSYSDFLPG